MISLGIKTEEAKSSERSKGPGLNLEQASCLISLKRRIVQSSTREAQIKWPLRPNLGEEKAPLEAFPEPPNLGLELGLPRKSQ